MSAGTGAYQSPALGFSKAVGGGWQAGQLLFPIRGSGRGFYLIMKKALRGEIINIREQGRKREGDVLERCKLCHPASPALLGLGAETLIRGCSEDQPSALQMKPIGFGGLSSPHAPRGDLD